jgi:phosphoribosylpyrophosphate synthetase
MFLFSPGSVTAIKTTIFNKNEHIYELIILIFAILNANINNVTLALPTGNE